MVIDQQIIIGIILEAIYKDEEVKELLILKGGQSLSFFGFSDRASYDIDFTITRAKEEEFNQIQPVLKKNLFHTFSLNGFDIIDYKFVSKPHKRENTLPPYWGGYNLEFKIIEKIVRQKIKEKNKGNDEAMQRAISNQAIPFGKNESTKVQLEFSYHEYSDNPMEVNLQGTDIVIKVYRPIIVVYEKIRALCQNIDGDHLPKNKRARSRDLYDIYSIIYSESIHSLDEEEIYSENNIWEVIKVFESKEVPIDLLLKLNSSYEILKKDFNETFIMVVPSAESIGFDYFFDLVDYLMKEIHSSILNKSLG